MAEPHPIVSCVDCQTFYQSIRSSLVIAAKKLAENSRWSSGRLIRDYIQGYHENNHDPDYALKEQTIG